MQSNLADTFNSTLCRVTNIPFFAILFEKEAGTMNPEVLGMKITDLRKRRGFTQRELAEQLHVTDKAVSKWERGINFPEITLLEPLATALNTTVIELLSLENATKCDVVDTFSTLSSQNKQRLLRELRNRAFLKITIELVLLAALITTSIILEQHQLFGLPQSLTGGMSGFVGLLIGSEIYFLRKLPSLR